MLRLAVWQESRNQEKIVLIATLEKRLAIEPAPLTQLIDANTSWSDLIHRRVLVTGTYDFEHEFALTNRRYGLYSGIHALTPLKIDSSDKSILVDRGFIPLEKSTPDIRKQFQKNQHVTLMGLVKENMPRKIFSPGDPDVGSDKPWADHWLRINIPEIQKQIPYPLLPVFLEIMEDTDPQGARKKIVATKSSGMQDILYLPNRGKDAMAGMDAPDLDYPIPSFDTIIPAGRHREYVYHWSFMALMTLSIGLILQLRRHR